MIFYGSQRVGKDGKYFRLWKLRTMKSDGGTPTASMNDNRLTSLGKWLRRFKLDELPTFWNLLCGDIAIVGPRPDVVSEIESLTPEIRSVVLSVKPGLISPATLWNIDEDALLKDEPDPHHAYCEKIKPTKYLLNVWYVENKSLWLDAKLVLATLLRLLRIPVTIRGISPTWLKPLTKGER